MSPVSTGLRRVGVVVHPARIIDGPLGALRRWSSERSVELVQVPVPGQERTIADAADAATCELIISIGGDGTMLAAIRAAAAAGRPAMGVACGSLGVLTSVDAGALPDALERFAAGTWSPRSLPALAITRADSDPVFALNDFAVVRCGIGQVRVTTHVDGILFSRLAGDGCIVSTPLGSSAYALAAGGALLMPDTDAYMLTPLPTHGGSRQPLVLGARSQLRLDVESGIGGARLEIDGQVSDVRPRSLTISFRPGVATLVTFEDQEPIFVGLRRRQIITDSPRIVADDDGG